MKKYISLALALFLGLSMTITSCHEPKGGDDEKVDEMPSLTVAPKEMKLYEGSEEKIVAVATPKGTHVIYTSSDAKIASVSADGNVKAIMEGNATITVKAGDLSEEVKVTVASLEELKARLIGTDGNEKAPLFYIPKANEMKKSFKLISMVNKWYGWVYATEMLKRDPDLNGYMFMGITPDGADYIDDRTIEILAYEYQHGKKPVEGDQPIIRLITKIKEKKSLFMTSSGKNRIKEFATLYGFTEGQHFDVDGVRPQFIAYNTQLGEDEKLQILIAEEDNLSKDNILYKKLVAIISYPKKN